jgi:phosphate transport system substrate-binding protein
MCKAGLSKTQAGLVKDWLNYAEGPGQTVAPKLEYAPLPAAIKAQAQAKIDGLQCNGAAIAAG